MNNHLVLLVGTNPLPNYVVAKYLLSQKVVSKIWLVYSEEVKRINQKGTKEISKRLRNLIAREYGNSCVDDSSLSDVGNAKQIKTDINEGLLEKIPKGASIHLNYTGGTKVMSVHVYNTLKESGKFDEKIFSYLSARTFRLRYEVGEPSEDLRKKVDISLKDLIELHGFESDDKEKGEEEKNRIFKDALDVLSKFVENGALKEFLEWKNSVLVKVYYDENRKFIEGSKKKAIEYFNKYSGGFERHSFSDRGLELLCSLPEEFSILNDEGNGLLDPGEISKKKYEHRVKGSVKEFLDGKWLESYVYRILSERMEKKHKDIKIECGLEPKRKDGKNLEIDLLLVNGYQVCGISCTTDKSEPLCKEKGFEVIHRVNQIGGEEGKAVLITCLSEKKEENRKDEKKIINQVKLMKEDLEYDTGGFAEKLLVLGIEDIENKKDVLWKKVEKHIWG